MRVLDTFLIPFVLNMKIFLPKTQFLHGRKLNFCLLSNNIVTDITCGPQNTQKRKCDWYQMLQWHVSRDNTFCKENINFPVKFSKTHFHNKNLIHKKPTYFPSINMDAVSVLRIWGL